MGSFRFCRSCGFDYEPEVSDASNPAPAVLAPVPQPVPDPEPSAGGGFSLPAPAPAPVATVSGGPAAATAGVIAVPVEPLKRLAGALIGALIGAMLAGAVVVPFLGDTRIYLAFVAAIVTISVAALLGMRAAIALASR